MSSQKLIIEVKSEFSQCYERLFNLAQRIKHPNPFLRPEWLALWWQFFGRGKSLYLIFCRYNDEDIGYAPFYKVDHPIMGITEFRLLGDNVASYLDWVCELGFEEKMADAIYDHFKKQKNGVIVHLKDFNNLYSHFFPFCKDKLESLESNCKGTIIPLYPCPYIEINKNWEDFFKSRRDSKSRYNLKSAEKKLNKMGEVIYRELINGEEVCDLFPIIQEIHQERFRHTINPLFRGDYRDFWKSVLKNMIPKYLSLSLIEMDGYPISFLIGFKMGDIFIDYAPAFDPAFSFVSLGQIHLKILMENKFREKYRIFDFSKGEADYKRWWSTGESQNYLLRLSFNLKRTGVWYERASDECLKIKVNIRKYGLSKYIKQICAKLLNIKIFFTKKVYIDEIDKKKFVKSQIPLSWSYKAIRHLPIEIRKAIIQLVLKCNENKIKMTIINHNREIYLFPKDKSNVYRIKF